MPIKANGTIEVMSYRTTRYDSDYEYPIKGVIEGGTVSHIAYEITLPATLKNRVLFDRFLANNPRIPTDDQTVDPVTGEKLLKVYFSFWPAQDQTLPVSTESKLFDHQHDSWISALGSPMSYNHRFTSYLSPVKETLAPRIPLLNYLFGYQVTMPPFLMFHEGLLKGSINRRFNDSKTEAERTTIFNEAVTKVKAYDAKYDAWFNALVTQQNAGHDLFASQASLDKLAAATDLANKALLKFTETLEDELRSTLFPGQDISREDFIEMLEEFISFGCPQVDSITMPLVESLDLEAILVYIKDHADNPTKYEYNLWSNNCATVILEALQLASKHCANQQLKQCFDYPWFVSLFGAPVSPAMVMKQLSKASDIIEAEYRASIPADVTVPVANVAVKRRKPCTTNIAAWSKPAPILVSHYDTVAAQSTSNLAPVVDREKLSNSM